MGWPTVSSILPGLLYFKVADVALMSAIFRAYSDRLSASRSGAL
jgi:hypothetical protein